MLYEMLGGRQAFRGEMVSDILASVLAREPDFTPFKTQLHPRLQEIAALFGKGPQASLADDRRCAHGTR
jgi:hypothetical protein